MLLRESAAALFKESSICEGTLYRREAQSKFDAGIKGGAKSYQKDGLKKPKRRIAGLEAELKFTKSEVDLRQREVPDRSRAL